MNLNVTLDRTQNLGKLAHGQTIPKPVLLDTGFLPRSYFSLGPGNLIRHRSAACQHRGNEDS